MINSIHDFLVLNCYRQGNTLTPAFRISRTYADSCKFFRITEQGIHSAILEAVDWYYIDFLNKPDSDAHKEARARALDPVLEECYANKLANMISNHSNPNAITFKPDYLHNNAPIFIKLQCRKVVRSFEYTLALQIPKGQAGKPIKATKIPRTIDDYFRTLAAYIATVTHETNDDVINHEYINHLYVTAKFQWFDEMAKRNAFVEKKLITERSAYDHQWFYQQVMNDLSALKHGSVLSQLMPKRKRVVR
ncbi:hypothetical protein [Photobacterium leiognathi]|uniref:hypothetical protein n=1 Tax=Photobacterium leiognathi TaxID=553611 RepID=UPI0029815DCB|nr:hypothetical protein [Photobacterium leiognathi]